ncbi:nuA3 HAT complex component nto1 [Geranomyces variabilis]|uniref:NuA3 HAT complex component nto1 n=1 Tax=Geranomyces variabilis TaxID=109894 RepID=A0AAD5TM40_9FUNG|nr:nuA3 HAT complex component nto1 [Geranomyces variabilis]
MIERHGHRSAPVTPLSTTPNLVEMPTRSRALHEQPTPARGRPRRIAPTPADSAASTPTASSSSFIPIIDPNPISETPAEEKPYRETFPDLEITKPLPILTFPRFQPLPEKGEGSAGTQNPKLSAEEQPRLGVDAASREVQPGQPDAGQLAAASAGAKPTEMEALDETQIDPLPPAPPSLDFDESFLTGASVNDNGTRTVNLISDAGRGAFPNVSPDDEANARTLASLARAAGLPDPQFQTLGSLADAGAPADPRPQEPLDVYSGVAELSWLPDLPPAPRHLPKPVFRTLPESDDPWAQRKFRMGDAYIRYVEPSEDELATRVEYDMDEQDFCWLNLVNDARKKEGSGQMDQDYFEQVMDILEKEWFDLTKDIPSPRDDEEDPLCAVCDDGECENSNAIVFCDGCNIAVHQDCYGIPYIPEGQWLCRKCMLSPHKPVDCVLCPHGDGAFKQAAGKGWAHLLCAIWVPECTVGNVTLMEPVVDIQKIPRSRWRLTCYLCQRPGGAPIQCSNKSCYTAFHATCARKARLYMKMKPPYGTDHHARRSFCDKHTPQEYRDEVDVEAAIKDFKKQMINQTTSLVRQITSLDDSDDESFHQSSDEETPRRKLKRKAIAYAHDLDTGSGGGTATPTRKKRGRLEGSLSTGQLLADFGVSDSETAVNISNQFSTPVVIPEYILRRVMENLREEHKDQKRKGDFDRKYKDFIILVCKYWSLKRESRRGAPLLKRLHLEPWTASASALKNDEAARAKRNQTAIIIRQDLEKVRLLVELIRKREKEKMRQYQAGVGYTELLLFPVARHIRPVFEQIRALDRNGYFSDPVTPEIAPDYFEHVKTPMDFSTIARKVDNYEYRDVDKFDADVDLIWTNCMIYNKSDTEYYKAASRYQKRAKALIAELRTKLAGLPIDPETGVMKIAPYEFISILWAFGWPEGTEERPIFPKADSPEPVPEAAAMEDKIISADDYTPFRVTRARIAALEAVTPVPKSKGSAKKNGATKQANSKTPGSSSMAEPKTPIRSSRRGKIEAVTPAPQVGSSTRRSSKAAVSSPVEIKSAPSSISRVRDRKKSTATVVTVPKTISMPVTPEPRPDAATASGDTSLAMAIRPARHAAEVAQKAISSLTTVIKRASVKKLTPAVVETPLTDREVRALKRGYGEEDATPSKPPSSALPPPGKDVQQSEESPDTPRRTKRLKLSDERVPSPLAETSGNTEPKAPKTPQKLPKSPAGKTKLSVSKSGGGEAPRTPLPSRGAGGRFLSASQAKKRATPADSEAPDTPVPNGNRTTRARLSSVGEASPAPSPSKRRVSLAEIDTTTTTTITTSRAKATPAKSASATASPLSFASRRRKSEAISSSAGSTTRRRSSGVAAASVDGDDAQARPFGVPAPPELEKKQDLDENTDFLALLGVGGDSPAASDVEADEEERVQLQNEGEDGREDSEIQAEEAPISVPEADQDVAREESMDSDSQPLHFPSPRPQNETNVAGD